MSKTSNLSRRDFMKKAGLVAGAAAVSVPAVAMAEAKSGSDLLSSFLAGATATEEEPAVEVVEETPADEARYMQLFLEYLDAEGIHYTAKDDYVSIGYACDNVEDGLYAIVYFNTSGAAPFVTVVSWDLGNVGEDTNNIIGAIITCNEMNGTWRWGKFYVDSDNDIAVRTDVYIDEATVGKATLAYVKRIIEVMDSAYPSLSPYVVA